MRIISGTHKGRIIHPPKNLPVRPTTDFAKESLFNILNNKVNYESLEVLDLFCGTGNISFEFLSRGCKNITSVDMNYNCISFVKKTAVEFGMNNLKTGKSDVFTFLKNCKHRFDIIFADPPYELAKLEDIPGIIFEKDLLQKEGILIIEHGKDTDFSKHPFFKERRIYGNVNFSFFLLEESH